jgi:hypothetical protein
MKKVIIIFFILIILGGVGFFFGWAQMPVSPGAYGVIRSKTHGVDETLIREGEFRWIWYKLIPANVETLVFALRPVSRPFRVQGCLPSGDTYAAAAGLDADFSYEISGTLSFTIKPELLPGMVKDGRIGDQAGLEEYENRQAQAMEALAVQRLAAYEREEQPEDAFSQTGTASRLEQDLYRAFPDAENLSCSLNVVKLPDFALYNLVRAVYEDYLAAQREILRADIADQAQRNIDSLLRFDELEKYGALLTKYPVLLQYLEIENSR